MYTACKDRYAADIPHLSTSFAFVIEVIARYLITLLDSRTPSFFEKHEPIHFSTIATPVCPCCVVALDRKEGC